MLHSHTPYRLLSDERLARLAAARDDRAFSALYERYEPALLGYCRSITRDPEDARDALQSAMAAAYAAAAGRGTGTGPVRAWLFRIAHNESVNVLRRRRGEVPLVDTDLTLVPSAADETTRRETAHEALADVAQLPPRQRGALVLRELHGLDYDEIAAALSVTEVNARQLVFAARSGVADSRAGRDLPCELVRDTIEAGDRRAQRRRPLRAHLRSCDECRAYARGSHTRPRRAILALPGGWMAGWAPFLNGGAGTVSGAGELMGPAKAVAVVAIAAAATGAATHDPPAQVVHATAAASAHAPKRVVARSQAKPRSRAVVVAAASTTRVNPSPSPQRTTASAPHRSAPLQSEPASEPRTSRPRASEPDRSATPQPHSHARHPDPDAAPEAPVTTQPVAWHGDDTNVDTHTGHDRRSAWSGSGQPGAGDGGHPVATRVDCGERSGQVAPLDGGGELSVGST